jgi:hypothetical protein
MEDVQTSWGLLPRWKARALALAEIQTVINAVGRDDSTGVGASALGEPDVSQPLAADAEPVKPTIDPEVMRMIEDRIDDLTARLDRYERRMAAEAALDALETEIERMYPPSPDDDGDLMLN